jgi:hypothetical protein
MVARETPQFSNVAPFGSTNQQSIHHPIQVTRLVAGMEEDEQRGDQDMSFKDGQ